MDLPDKIEAVLKTIVDQAEPVSIFLYGSRARTDFKENSDYEIGILFKRDKKWSRSDLSKLHQVDGLNLYPFVYEDFVKYDLDTPFPKAIYMRELIEGAKTLKGERVVEGMKPPIIKASDLLERSYFDMGYALAAIMSSRQSDWITASQEFSKSVLFGTRVLIILQKKLFPLSYDDIFNESKELDIETEYKELIFHAVQVRKGSSLDTNMLYTNISFLNKVVIKKIHERISTLNSIVLN